MCYTGFYYHEPPNVATIDPKFELQDHEEVMMYDDAECDLGHRDNILDK